MGRAKATPANHFGGDVRVTHNVRRFAAYPGRLRTWRTSLRGFLRMDRPCRRRYTQRHLAVLHASFAGNYSRRADRPLRICWLITPMAENRPTSGTTKLLKGKLLSLANGPDVPTDQHAWDQGWHRRALQWSNPGRQAPLLRCLCGDVPRAFDPSIRYDASNPRGGLNLMLT